QRASPMQRPEAARSVLPKRRTQTSGCRLFRRAYSENGGVIPSGITAMEARYDGRAIARPRIRFRNATGGGGKKRAGRAGPVLLDALWQAGRCHHWVPAGAPLGWKNFANRAANVSLLGVHASLARSMDAVAVFSDPFGACHTARL